MKQPNLYANFNGDDYQPARDNPRLRGQLLRVWTQVKDGRWQTLRSIADATGDPEASVSAQLRHLRKERFGGYEIEKRHVRDGLYEYRLYTGSNNDS
jgi:hypothetical protein